MNLIFSHATQSKTRFYKLQFCEVISQNLQVYILENKQTA